MKRASRRSRPATRSSPSLRHGCTSRPRTGRSSEMTSRSGHDWLMAEDTRKPEISIQVTEVLPGTEGFEAVLELAAQVLAQDRYLTPVFPAADESHVLAAFWGARCVGFLRYLIQVIGADEG